MVLKFDEKMKEQKIRQFILENHNIVEEYHKCYRRRYKEDDFKEQLRVFFINVLSAGGEGHIDVKAKSLEKFDKIINSMKENTYSELLRVFGAKPLGYLFQMLKNLDQIHDKRAALYLRDILYFGDVISDFPPSLKKDLRVPVDKVIKRATKSIFGDDSPKDFNGINELAKKIFPDEPILLEDLWFWGRFYCRENDKKLAYCRFNRDLLIVDNVVTKACRLKLLDFAEKHENCPFKGICSRKPLPEEKTENPKP